MKVPMGPPSNPGTNQPATDETAIAMGPPPNPSTNQPATDGTATAMGPPPNPSTNQPATDETATAVESRAMEQPPKKNIGGGGGAPYSIPPWSEPPQHPFFLEVLKDGAIIDKFDVGEHSTEASVSNACAVVRLLKQQRVELDDNEVVDEEEAPVI